MAFPQYFITELEARSNMTDIAESYVDLKKRGRNYVGLCPFHNEKTPSFNIYPETNSFYCFGCNAGGGVINFVMRIENLDFQESVRFLAQRAGMSVPEDGVDDSLARLRTRILEVNRETARFFHANLGSQEGKAALAYLRSRHLTDKTIKHFGLGYAPRSGFELVNHLKAKGFSQNEMTQANVAGTSKNGNAYDRFKGRVMFPIIDLRGNVVAFGGRILTDEKPKYINTSDTYVYKKSRELFALNFAKDSGKKQLILAEGYMDVISLHQAGFTNTVASLGTSLTEEQAKVISRYAEEVVICYDSDEAGQRAAQRAIPILKRANLYVKVLAVPGNKDPDEFISSHGEDGPVRFGALLEEAGSDVEYELNKLRARYDMESTEDLIKYRREAVEIIARLDSRGDREVYSGKIATETDINRLTVIAEAEEAHEKRRKQNRRDEIKKQSKVAAVESSLNREKRFNARVANAEEGIIAYLFKHQDMAFEISGILPPEDFLTAVNRRIYDAVLQKADTAAVNISDFSAELTADEMSELARIIASRAEQTISKEDASAFIKVIRNEASVSPDRLKAKTPEELNEWAKNIRKSKQGEF